MDHTARNFVAATVAETKVSKIFGDVI